MPTTRICFMVMPFGKKATGDTDPKSTSPSQVDFDALWTKALAPVLEELGYQAIRADAEAGSVILEEMLQRLRYADLVLADVSIPNGNVYYEVGIRHAASEKGCVLIGAKWAKRLFDLAQVRTLPYAHAGETITDEEAAALKATLRDNLSKFAAEKTPYHVLTKVENRDLFRSKLEAISVLQARIRRTSLLPREDARKEATDLVKEFTAPAATPPVEGVQALVTALRDLAFWELQIELIQGLREEFRHIEMVQEQLALAKSERGDIEGAATELVELNRRYGPTVERLGMLGGRYKRLWNKNKDSGPQAVRFLNQAINAYETGMQLDLNGYYCSCNLPALLRERGLPGDAERAKQIDVLVTAACKRAEVVGTTDPFLQPTLFGAAFRSGDVASAAFCLGRMLETSHFPIETTVADAERWIKQADESVRPALQALLDQLKSYLPKAK